jgi:hypothetical protein
VKKIAGVAVLVLLCSVPACAQSAPHFVGGGGAAVNTTYAGGGAGGGGGLSAGGNQPLPNYPPTRFAMHNVTGDSSDYVPSTFVSYQKALAEGQALISSRPQTLDEAARENNNAAKLKAKFIIVQNNHGEAVIRPH